MENINIGEMSKNYGKALAECEGKLKADPDNYDIAFECSRCKLLTTTLMISNVEEANQLFSKACQLLMKSDCADKAAVMGAQLKLLAASMAKAFEVIDIYYAPVFNYISSVEGIRKNLSELAAFAESAVKSCREQMLENDECREGIADVCKQGIYAAAECCSVRIYERDMGKNVMTTISAADENTGADCVKKYDGFVAEIKKYIPGFEPDVEIQRGEPTPEDIENAKLRFRAYDDKQKTERAEQLGEGGVKGFFAKMFGKK